jgi:AcrR family transcriptional regulator
MARRTKDEAQQTRTAILDAAETVFIETGVSNATLQKIAEKAGVTRGAVYWHFRDKLAIIHALVDRVVLPEEAFLDALLAKDSDTPILDLEKSCLDGLKRILGDEHHRRVLTILILRTEYLDDMRFLIDRQIECMDRIIGRFSRVFEKAKGLGQLAAGWTPQTASYALNCLYHGFIIADIKVGAKNKRGRSAAASLSAFFGSLKA